MNLNHKYHVRDVNGALHATATTKHAAGKRARRLAESVGLDMQVCYGDRTPFGMQYRIVWYRTQDTRMRSRRRLNLDGTWTIGR